MSSQTCDSASLAEGGKVEDAAASLGNIEPIGRKTDDNSGLVPAGSVVYFHEDDGASPPLDQAPAAIPTASVTTPAAAVRGGLGAVRLPPGRPPGRCKPAGPAAVSVGSAARPMRKSKMAAADHILALTLQQHGSRRDFEARGGLARLCGR